MEEIPGELLAGAHGRHRLVTAGVGPGELRGAPWNPVLPGHAGADQRAVDNARHETLERHGLQVVRVAAGDLTRFRRRTVVRLQEVHRRGLARDRSNDAWVCGPLRV